ncbi:MAG TPA: GNAT family N-acetyltransferase [Thermodesulfovibrionales bacterium]|nr:GNAT family N-acetyltransferase [Thermodesulfovibrionales bacterium]
MEMKEPQDTTSPEGALKVRPAQESDLAFIREELVRNNIDAENLDHREFLVAAEDGGIAGFGRLRRTGQFYQIGCIAVVEEKRGRGVGSLLIKHLIENTPVKLVYIVTDLVEYFQRMGFVEMKESSKEFLDALDEACKVKGKPNTVVMVFERPGK